MKKANLLLVILLFGITYSQLMGQTTIVLQPDAIEGKDAAIRSGNPTMNYGDWESIVSCTWTFNGDLTVKRIFLEFDLSAVPENATIIDAKLSLFYNSTDTTEPTFDFHTGDNNLYIQRVMSDWDENTIIWNNQPPTTTENRVELPPSSSPTQDYLGIDVTSLVVDMITSYEGNNGFMISIQNEFDPYKSVLFASSEHIDALLHPKLEVTYTLDSLNCITIKPNAIEGKDAAVLSANPTKNYAAYESIVSYIWTYGGAPAIKRIFLEFDFSIIPENAVIADARLSLFYNPTDTTEPTFNFHTGDNDLYIQRVTTAWDESTLIWNNQPPTTTENRVELPQSNSPTQDYTDINVTNLVIDMLTSYDGNNGFMLSMKNEFDPYKSVLLASSDHLNNSLHPEIEVCWIVDTTSIGDIGYIDHSLNIYPNPSGGLFEVSIAEYNLSEFDLEIYSISGQKVTEFSILNDNQFVINDNGLFIIVLIDQNGNRMFEKAIVQ